MTRKEIVTVKKRAAVEHDPREQAREKQNACAVSHQPLQAPVVVCAMGLLYNKEALLQALLSKQLHAFPHFSHISGLKDVSAVSLTWASKHAAASAAETKEQTDAHAALYTCPITSLPSNGANKFIAMQPCGCVISDRAWKSVRAGNAEAACLVCAKPVAPDTAPPAVQLELPSVSAAAAASSVAAESTAPAAHAAFHHPAYITLFPSGDEVLYLRAVLSLKRHAKDAAKALAKASKADKKSLASSLAAPMEESKEGDSTVPAGHKRKAQYQSVASPSSSLSHADKKQIAPPAPAAGAHAALVASRTGNTISDSVKRITAAASASVAERKKDSNFSRMFLTQEQLRNFKPSPISTKPESCMSML
jgi:hypothetical protein